MLPSLYYSKLVPSGKDGELLGMLFVDSVLMVCSNYTLASLQATELVDHDLIWLTKTLCADPTWV